jgi:hypothetical protein
VKNDAIRPSQDETFALTIVPRTSEPRRLGWDCDEMFVVVRGDFGAEPEYMRENMCCVRDASSIARRARVHLS